MTQRERQLLNWIEENPLISQQELADKAGITRSSVAVHISNLMKKGYITGKGYIVHTAPYVTVVGGVNMDIGGWPGEVPVMQDSNPGVVRMSLGGVGRNIAHNMALLGMDVRLLTVFGDDINAQKIAANSRFMKTASFFISTSLSAQTVILFPVLQIFPEIIIFLKFVLDILLSLRKISIRLEV